jgi:hypothetical protein
VKEYCFDDIYRETVDAKMSFLISKSLEISETVSGHHKRFLKILSWLPQVPKPLAFPKYRFGHPKSILVSAGYPNILFWVSEVFYWKPKELPNFLNLKKYNEKAISVPEFLLIAYKVSEISKMF